MNYWIGIASKDHVLRGVAGGFCQLGHGKSAPLERLKPGDIIVYYSPRDRFEGGAILQAFTAIGEIKPGEVYQSNASGFCPFRRDVNFFEARDALIRPLLEQLSFTRGQRSWGAPFRRGRSQLATTTLCALRKRWRRSRRFQRGTVPKAPKPILVTTLKSVRIIHRSARSAAMLRCIILT